MGPLPRIFPADAYDCIMVPILTDRPNTRMRAIFAPDSEPPSELSSSVLTTRRLTNISLPPCSLLVTVKSRWPSATLDRHCAAVSESQVGPSR
jgi:hypothetical protein